jgi:hypothetical protein
MTKVTNQSTVSVTVVGNDGSSESLRPGESKNVSYDSKNVRNRAYLNAGAISVEGQKAASSEAPRSAPRSSSRKATKSSAKKAPATPAEGSPQT